MLTPTDYILGVMAGLMGLGLWTLTGILAELRALRRAQELRERLRQVVGRER